MPESRLLSADKEGYARTKADVRLLELDVYARLLGRREHKPYPVNGTGDVERNALLTLIEWGFRLWRKLPEWAKGYIWFNQHRRGIPRRDLLSNAQQRLVGFLANPSEGLDDLLLALAGNYLRDPISRRLTWLALAKWMELVEKDLGEL